MTKLSVNVNKLATLRNSRGKNNPNVLDMAKRMVSFGAEGITIHPRPDARHIRRDDVFALAANLNVELNIEGYPSDDFLDLINQVKPAQCTLVPDPPHVLTSNAGWTLQGNLPFLKQVISRLHHSAVRVSLFIDPNGFDDFDMLQDTKTDRIELYTESYAESFGTEKGGPILDEYKRVAKTCQGLGIGVNAGHDLNLENLKYFLSMIPNIDEVSIGHALICDALEFGMQETIKRYLSCIQHDDHQFNHI